MEEDCLRVQKGYLRAKVDKLRIREGRLRVRIICV